MSFTTWLKNIFVPQHDLEGGQEDTIREDAPSIWNEHMRIVLAIIVVFISALVMWWILI